MSKPPGVPASTSDPETLLSARRQFESVTSVGASVSSPITELATLCRISKRSPAKKPFDCTSTVEPSSVLLSWIVLQETPAAQATLCGGGSQALLYSKPHPSAPFQTRAYP